MNKKIKIYSSMLLLVIIVSALPNVVHFNYYSSAQNVGEKMELVDYPSDIGINYTSVDGDTTCRKSISYEVNVVPNIHKDRKVLISNVLDQSCEVTLQKVKLEFPVQNTSGTIPMVIAIIIIIGVIAIALWILYIVVKTIRSIRKGEIFASQVAKNLEKLGIILSVLYLIQLLGSYIITQYLISHIHLAYHSVVFKNECNIMLLIMGLSLMVVSQIILMGKDLKEENDLTI